MENTQVLLNIVWTMVGAFLPLLKYHSSVMPLPKS